jgi:heme/copper-type cytochrome/quinol oxidase subunit 2
MGFRKKKRKKKRVNIRSPRGRRRAEKVETTGNVFKLIAFLLMMVFYMVMLYFIYTDRAGINNLLGQFTNSTLPSVIITIITIIKKIINVLGVV